MYHGGNPYSWHAGFVDERENILYKYLKWESGKSKATYCMSDDELHAKKGDILRVRSSVKNMLICW